MDAEKLNESTLNYNSTLNQLQISDNDEETDTVYELTDDEVEE